MSSILLDTHAFIWLSEDDPSLPTPTRELIEATDDVFVSIASFWEISIKLTIGKISLQTNFVILKQDSILRDLNYCRFLFKIRQHFVNCRSITKTHSIEF